MIRYKQTKKVSWLNTPEGTIWTTYGNNNNWIQPEDESLRETLLGVDLDLLDDTEFETLFETIV